MRISDWSSDVCSSDLAAIPPTGGRRAAAAAPPRQRAHLRADPHLPFLARGEIVCNAAGIAPPLAPATDSGRRLAAGGALPTLRTGAPDRPGTAVRGRPCVCSGLGLRLG